LKNAIFYEPADRIVSKCRGDSRSESEASAKTAGHVVLSATLPYLKLASCVGPAFSGVEAQHNLA
jgi:hypothetical protein